MIGGEILTEHLLFQQIYYSDPAKKVAGDFRPNDSDIFYSDTFYINLILGRMYILTVTSALVTVMINMSLL